MRGFEWISLKRKVCDKFFLSDNDGWSSNNLLKIMPADVKANAKQQEIKDLVAYLTNAYKSYL